MTESLEDDVSEHTGEQQLTYGSGKKLMWSWQLARLITAPLML